MPNFDNDFGVFLGKTDAVHALIADINLSLWEGKVPELCEEIPGLESALEEQEDAHDAVKLHEDYQDKADEYNERVYGGGAGCYIGCYGSYQTCIFSPGCNGMCLYWCSLLYAKCKDGCTQ